MADLEARKAQLEVTIAQIRAIMGQPGVTGGPVPPGGGGGYNGATPAHDAFIGLSIPEAAKKHLGIVRKKLSTQDLMAALELGGLPPSKYSTVYGVLSRRESKVGDIVNIKGDWALAEWYPNYRKKTKASESSDNSERPESDEARDGGSAEKAESKTA